MTAEQKEIFRLLQEILEKYPDFRFGQLLYVLNVTQFSDITNPEHKDFDLRDIFYDSDEYILKRIKEAIEKAKL